MDVTPLSIEGAYLFSARVHGDDRGSFHEWFRADVFHEVVGHDLHIAQANSSTSAAGTIRGIHFAELPPSQAKYVSCAAGAIVDVVVDIRVGSPTYGHWEAVSLSGEEGRLVYLSEGLGHAFIAVSDQAVVNYLCSAPYAPAREHGINPFDEQLGVEWPTNGSDGRALEHVLSPKDAAAPGLEAVRAAGLLAGIEDCRRWRNQLP